MSLREIMARRILILSGKGGAGKSALTAALALRAAEDGKRTLLVEMDTVETIPRIFGKSGGEHYKEIPLDRNIHCLHVDGKSGLEEYLQLIFKTKRLTNRIFRSPAYQYFVNVAPGLKELMAVGKIWDLEQETLPGSTKPRYDLFIVDTPATGHALSYLRMPMAAANTLKRGFVQKEAQKVVDLLQDPKKTSFNIVTTLGEMPVNEAVELYEKSLNELRLPMGCLFVNQVFQPFFSGHDLERFRVWKQQVERETTGPAELSSIQKQETWILSCAESWRRKRERQEAYLGKVRQVFSCEIVTLPFLSGFQEPLSFVRRLADALPRNPGVDPRPLRS